MKKPKIDTNKYRIFHETLEGYCEAARIIKPIDQWGGGETP